jgi:hypothetical protein
VRIGPTRVIDHDPDDLAIHAAKLIDGMLEG